MPLDPSCGHEAGACLCADLDKMPVSAIEAYLGRRRARPIASPRGPAFDALLDLAERRSQDQPTGEDERRAREAKTRSSDAVQWHADAVSDALNILEERHPAAAAYLRDSWTAMAERGRQIEAVWRQVALDAALREPPTATVEPGSGARAAWTPTVGARVVTAAKLTAPIYGVWGQDRSPSKPGTARLAVDGHGRRWMVRHDDCTEAPYAADEPPPVHEVAK
jgi:hypothetical protein